MGGDQEIFGEQINNINIHVFTCGQININVYTKYAIEPSENIYIEQKAIIDTGKGKRMYILDNNQLDIQENKYGDEYFGVLRAYKCATGKYNKEYMVLLYSVGGNCQRCAWVVLAAHDMSGFVAHDLSGSCFTCIGGEHEADGVATGDPDETISGSV